MLSENIFFDLSLLSYYDCYGTNISVSQMIEAILNDEDYLAAYADLDYFEMNLELIKKMDRKAYEDVMVADYVDDNANSGVVYFVFETKDAYIFAFRGSEPLDDIRQTTGWQDWMDNFRMFLPDPTYQQLFTLHKLQQRKMDKPFYLTGHSKGGNLAIYCAVTMKDELLKQLQGVIAFNAPGISKAIYEVYQERIESYDFKRKIALFENENDCVSAFFEHIKQPYLIQSSLSCNNLEELYHNHNLYGMSTLHDNTYLLVEKKSAVPTAIYYFVNNFFVNLKETKLKKFIDRMDDYFMSGLSMFELYRVFIYHISKYTNLFEDIPYEEIKTITFQDLMERRKSKILFDKMMTIQPIEALQKAKDSVNKNDFDIRTISDGFLKNYELLRSKTSQNIADAIARNNAFIQRSIHAIRTRNNEDEQEDEIKDNQDVSCNDDKNIVF